MLIRHRCTMIVRVIAKVDEGGMLIQIWAAINSVAGRSTTGNVGGRLIRRGVCFDQRQKIWVPCRDRLLGLEE